MGLPGRQRSLTLSSAVWIECTNVTDRQTDQATAKTALTHSVARKNQRFGFIVSPVFLFVSYSVRLQRSSLFPSHCLIHRPISRVSVLARLIEINMDYANELSPRPIARADVAAAMFCGIERPDLYPCCVNDAHHQHEGHLVEFAHIKRDLRA